MPLHIVPFEDYHLNQAADLLTARHRADRQRDQVLPAKYERRAAARAAIEKELAGPDVAGVAALQDGRMAGYLIGRIVLPSPLNMYSLFIRPRSASIGLAGHAVESEEGYDTYRAMYAALAPRWVKAGCFSHYIYVPATDESINDAWFSLGFGEDMASAVRGTEPVTVRNAAPDLEIHQAGSEDLDVVMDLVQSLMRYHAEAPIFFPYLPETEPSQREFQQEMLKDSANAHWIAYRAGRPLGIQTFRPPMLSELLIPERSTYLLQGFTYAEARGSGVGAPLLDHSMAWAREAGYEHCTLNFMTANLAGARFWLSHGFRPIEYRLFRQVDERIAWASGTE